jgi:hypothetical protein
MAAHLVQEAEVLQRMAREALAEVQRLERVATGRATNKRSQISASDVNGFGPLWLSLGATFWAIPG